MAANDKKRQKTLQRKAAKRKQKRQAISRVAHAMRVPSLNKAGEWPVHEVLLSDEWDEEGAIVQILIARRAPTGHIGLGVFLIDLGCLGVKNAIAATTDLVDYQEQRSMIMERQPLAEADLDLCAKIISASVAYAKELGFSPHRDYYKAIKVLGDADPDACDEAIPLGGPEGKPYFFAGPYDNADRVIAKLTKAVGPDGFHYVLPIKPPLNEFGEIDEDEVEFRSSLDSL